MIGELLRHYRIEAKLGAGGMGVVYRARDTHLDRSVAIKVLPSAALLNPERRIRFVQEAKAASALSHPNIITIHDIDTAVSGDHAIDFIAMEYISGKTLDQLIARKGLRLADVLRYGIQVADALAAAHAIGIVHRDLKPANVMVNDNGVVKLLDFGLAKLAEPAETDIFAATESIRLDLTAQTEQGSIVGTVAYMSPEQAEGHKLDVRSDIFSFGAVLYEMSTGRRAFSGDSKLSTLASILHVEPPPASAAAGGVPAELDKIIARCLKKDPQRRWQTMADIRVALQELQEEIESKPPGAAPAGRARPARPRWIWAAAAVLAFTGGAAAGRLLFTSPPPKFQRLTFRRGDVSSAKFAPDGQTILYTAQWDGAPSTIFSTRAGSRESRSLDLPESRLLSISRSAEMAILLGNTTPGTLARVPLAGGAPREILENVSDADWSPDGASLAVVRGEGRKQRVEYPIGKLLYEAEGRPPLSLRVSRSGDAVAFFDFDNEVGDFAVVVVDRDRNRRVLSRGWKGTGLLEWSPNGKEVWFTAAKTGGDPALRAVTRNGSERIVLQAPVWMLLHDVAPDGRLLLAAVTSRIGIIGAPPGATAERDLSWLDTSMLSELSANGKQLLFAELSYGEGRNTAIYLRKMDGSPAVRLGDGIHPSLSPDGKWVVCIHASGQETQLLLLPTGPGEARTLPVAGIHVEAAEWFSGGKRILFTGNAPNHAARTYVDDLETLRFEPVTAEGMRASTVSPDEKYVVTTAAGKLLLQPLGGGPARAVADLNPAESVIRWSGDGAYLFLRRMDGPAAAAIERLNVATGRRELWKQLSPPDPVGVAMGPVSVASDGGSYAYSFQRDLANLYLADGLK